MIQSCLRRYAVKIHCRRVSFRGLRLRYQLATNFDENFMTPEISDSIHRLFLFLEFQPARNSIKQIERRYKRLFDQTPEIIDGLCIPDCFNIPGHFKIETFAIFTIFPRIPRQILREIFPHDLLSLLRRKQDKYKNNIGQASCVFDAAPRRCIRRSKKTEYNQVCDWNIPTIDTNTLS